MSSRPARRRRQGGSYFTREAFAFLEELAANNDRAWFAANRDRYDEHLRTPALRVIADIGPALAKISPHISATPRSLYRIHRDTRFSRDKTPYKTQLGLHFRHERARDAHAPGLYFHAEPGHVFAGAGVWRPESAALRAIRERIVEEPAAWKRASRAPVFLRVFEPAGGRLTRPPRGFDPEHPLVEDLKWKDYVGIAVLDEDFVTHPELPAELARIFGAARGFLGFLCDALGVPF